MWSLSPIRQPHLGHDGLVLSSTESLHSIFVLSSQCLRGVPSGMSEINADWVAPDSSDRQPGADLLVREEPDDDEDDEEDDDKGDNGEDEDDGEGYSE